MTHAADLTDEQIDHRLAVIGAQWRVASDARRDRLHSVVDELLDERAAREQARVC